VKSARRQSVSRVRFPHSTTRAPRIDRSIGAGAMPPKKKEEATEDVGAAKCVRMRERDANGRRCDANADKVIK